MITKIIDNYSTSIIPEESDDLLTLRRVIVKGDRVVGDTTRVIKQDKDDYSRPDRGKRVHIRIAINVEKISLDNVLDKMRIQGTILESNNDSVPHGSYHSFVIKINQGFTLTKKKWSKIQRDLLKSNQQQLGFLLVAIDTSDCGIGRLKGTRLQIVPNIYSEYSGKRYKTTFNLIQFFDQIKHAVSNTVKEKDTIIIFGPGETRKKFSNHLKNSPIAKKHKIIVAEGIESSGEDGLYIFTKSDSMKDIISESKLALVSTIIDKIMFMANKKSTKFAMGFEEIRYANQCGAIDSLVFSEKILETVDEDEIIEFLNTVEASGAKTYSVDSSTDVGLRVTGLGGIIALLRFSIS
jgi:protein pelota